MYVSNRAKTKRYDVNFINFFNFKLKYVLFNNYKKVYKFKTVSSCFKLIGIFDLLPIVFTHLQDGPVNVDISILCLLYIKQSL